MSEHTKEPWSFYDDRSSTGRIEIVGLGKTVARIYLSVPSEDFENARRIVACVNACAGMDDPESQIRHLKNFCNPRLAENADAILLIAGRHVDERFALIKQRGELVAALEKARDLIDKHLKWDRRIDDDMDFIDGVLAKAGADDTVIRR